MSELWPSPCQAILEGARGADSIFDAKEPILERNQEAQTFPMETLAMLKFGNLHSPIVSMISLPVLC